MQWETGYSQVMCCLASNNGYSSSSPSSSFYLGLKTFCVGSDVSSIMGLPSRCTFFNLQVIDYLPVLIPHVVLSPGKNSGWVSSLLSHSRDLLAAGFLSTLDRCRLNCDPLFSSLHSFLDCKFFLTQMTENLLILRRKDISARHGSIPLVAFPASSVLWVGWQPATPLQLSSY
jgi:hypothetical protein